MNIRSYATESPILGGSCVNGVDIVLSEDNIASQLNGIIRLSAYCAGEAEVASLRQDIENERNERNGR